MNNKKNKIKMVLLVGIVLTLFAGAFVSSYTSVNPNYGLFDSYVRTGETKLDDSMCKAGQDFLIQIAPFGCTPAVVRSDLLEEQNVPVFCQLAATKINPLIDVEAVESVSFSGKYPKEVSGVGFHPARAALGVKSNLNSPLFNNIGYVVIVLKKQQNESDMADYVKGNLTAKIKYDIKNAFGIGKANFYLPQMDEETWEDNKIKYSFWNGKGYLKADGIDVNSATISIRDDVRQISSVKLRKGETSQKIALPGFDCLASLQLKLQGLVNPDTMARLRINADYVEVARGEKFLENKCIVRDMQKQGLVQKVTINCREDQGSKTFNLMISPKVKLSIDGKEREVGVGEALFRTSDNKRSVYVGYIGTKGNTEKLKDLYLRLVAMPTNKDKLSDNEISSMARSDHYLSAANKLGDGLFATTVSLANIGIGATTELGKAVLNGQRIDSIVYEDGEETIFSKNLKLIGFAGAFDFTNYDEYDLNVKAFLDYYKKAINDYNVIQDSFAGEKESDVSGVATFDEQALAKAIQLAEKTEQKRTMVKLCEEFKENYPKSTLVTKECDSEYKLANSETSNTDVSVNGKVNRISFDGIYEPTTEEYSAEIFIKNPDGTGRSVILKKNQIEYLDANGPMMNRPGTSIVNLAKEELKKWGGRKDTESYTKKYLDKYWDAVGKSFFDIFNDEWSAAFISYLMKEQGINFPFNLNHATYFSSIRDNPGKYECTTHKISEIDFIKEGDILCKCREEANCIGNYEISKGTKSHCDVVSSISGGNVELIGGNLANTVLKMNVPLSSIKKVNSKYYGFISCSGSQGESGTEYVQLLSLDNDVARIKVNFKPKGTIESVAKFIVSTRTKTLKLKESDSLGSSYTFTLTNVKLKKLAKVSVIPGINNAGTEANFSFMVGIEKRSIQLSPEKTKDKIEKLNKTIEKWEENSAKLGKVVKGLKGACLGVGAALTVKNFFANTGGKAIARQNVMRATGGWNDKCAELVEDKKYESREQCMVEEADNIDRDVEAYAKELERQNEEARALQEGITETTFLGERKIDDDEYKKRFLSEEYKKNLKTNLKNKFGDEINMGSYNVNVDEFVNNLNVNLSSIEELKSLQLYSRFEGSLSGMAEKELKSNIGEIYIRTKSEVQRTIWSEELNKAPGLNNVGVGVYAHKDAIDGIYNGGTTGEKGFGNIPANSHIEAIVYGEKYLLKLEKTSGNEYVVEKVYDNSGNPVSKDAEKKVKDRFRIFKSYDRSSYQNKYTNAKLRYFETEPYKGNPAIVPFDLKNGWYASMAQTLPIGGNIKSYDESGRLTSFYLCNVGKNGREENRKGDDPCRGINFVTGQPYDLYPGLSKKEASELVTKAKNAVLQASKLYKKGLSGRVKILNEYVEVGSPAADIPDVQCQDFMSPKDCQLLFNVCDPVICPSSRCDFDGAYPVKDVIQSGIIGSIALCLPNFKEGIYIPVCLTGIKAGIDGLLSIFTSYRDCLQENLDTGKMVGICDEIYSIYLCDFFWRQALPLTKIIIPKMMEIAMGQNVQGGGEYMGVASAWESAGKSADFFVQYYAANSYEAFKSKVTEQVKAVACKSFLSVSYPSGGNLLDSLTEPDSPAQFHGRFDEIPFTSTTVPPVSHYKVYFHIYAGKESRAFYKVYLKGAEESSFYQDISPMRIIASGYVPTGGSVDETPDFTAPSGYKQLCIMVNNQEECGFGSVSTDFAINYMKDKYLEEQGGETDIKSETECIAGSASVYSLLSPSVQGGAEDILNPGIYDQGIIRICSTDNPGKGTDNYAGTAQSRWKEVGNCGDKNIKCWLDTKSVENVIKNTDIENRTLSKVSADRLKVLLEEGKYLKTEEFSAKIKEIDSKKTPREKITLINKIYDKVFYNKEKANLLLLRGNAYGVLATDLFRKISKLKEDTPNVPLVIGEKSKKDEMTREEALKLIKNLDGDYSDKENKQIIDKICNQRLLTEEECDEIDGFSWFNFGEENTEYVEKILEERVKRPMWNFDTAIEKVNKFLKEDYTALYDTNNEVKSFMDQLYEDSLLSADYYATIKIRGLKDLKNTLLLNQKNMKEEISSNTDSPLDLDDTMS